MYPKDAPVWSVKFLLYTKYRPLGRMYTVHCTVPKTIPVYIHEDETYLYLKTPFLHMKVYKHRIGRVRSFSPVVGIGTPPTPNPQASVSPPPLVLGGETHSLAREGMGESQFRRGDIHCGTLYICTLCLQILGISVPDP
jgi:hypothetical protein